MSPAHRKGRQPLGLSTDLAADHPWGVLAAAVALIAAVAMLGVFFATTGGPGTSVAPATVSAPVVDPLKTPQALAYFGALYTDGGIGPNDLTASNALKLGQHVCSDLHGGVSLAGSYAYVRDVTKLDRMQAARLVDAADRELCR